MIIQVVSMLASAEQSMSFHVLTFEFYLHVLNRIITKISVCFYNYSPHSKPPVLGSSYVCMLHSSYVCMLHDKLAHCFVIFAEVGVKIFLIEFPLENTCFLMQPVTIRA
jgi:hypothetical protein